jgi:addiction module HigA family antidote
MTKQKSHKYLPDYAVPPGETLVEILDSLDMTQVELAKRSGRPVKTINEIIKNKATITPGTALQFERILDMPASFWNNLEKNYQDACARIDESKYLLNHTNWLHEFPITDMAKLGWITFYQDTVEQFRELLNFFGVASPVQWQPVFATEQVAYRKSNVYRSSPHVVAAWLRKGDIEARQIKCKPFDRSGFREALQNIRHLTVEEEPDAFLPEMKHLTANAGVAVTFVRELPGMSVSGAARWLSSSKALIQLTLRHKSNDHLWFSFFHEAGHILYDGKREVFLDGDVTDRKTRSSKETRADRFATNFLIPPTVYNAFVQTQNFTPATVTDFARQHGIAPGIVVGRLQHDKVIPFNKLNNLKVRYKWVGRL